MSEIFFQFETEIGADNEHIQNEIKKRLSLLNGVTEADAEVSSQKIGLQEVVTIITAAVLVLKEGRSMVAQVRGFIPEIINLIKDIKGIKDAFIEIGSERKRLKEISDTDLQKLGESIDIA